MKFDGCGTDGQRPAAERTPDRATDRTRDAVARVILERGPQTAAAIGEQLGLSPAAIRRHLDALVEDGLLVDCEPRPSATRGRGRPARRYALTDAGRAAFPHGYDDLATTALRYLHSTGGQAAVAAFAEHRADTLAVLLEPALVGAAGAEHRAEALAGSLSANGYAATTEQALAGVQVCQHHCPVAHVAAQFPQLCEAETRAFERLLGTNVQRLATIAHGDGVCTTHIPTSTVPIGTSTTGTSTTGTTGTSTTGASTTGASTTGTSTTGTSTTPHDPIHRHTDAGSTR